MLPLILFLLLTSTFASFTPQDLPGPFLRRRGTSCPRFLEISHSSSTPPSPSSVSVFDEACTAGTLRFDNTEDLLARYLAGNPDAGQTLSLFVEDALICTSVTFQPGAVFTFVKPSGNVTVDFSRVFGRNGTDVAADGTYSFLPSSETLVINDRCLYTRLTAEEIDAQRGECFPENAVVVTKRGTLRIDEVQTGDVVCDGKGWTAVIGWTHRDQAYRGPFVRLRSTGGVVTLSKGHYIYTDGGLVQAGRVTPGMRISNGVVQSVEVVTEKGLYNMQTESGDVVVDDVLCSTYTSMVKPATAHALLTPVRACARVGLDLLTILWRVGKMV